MQDHFYDLQVRLGHAGPNVVDAPHPGRSALPADRQKADREINTRCLPQEMIAQVRGLTSCNLKYRPSRLVLNFDRAVITHWLQIAFGHLLGLGIIDRFDKGTGARCRKPSLSSSSRPMRSRKASP